MHGLLNKIALGSVVQVHGDRIVVIIACGDRLDACPSDLWSLALDSASGHLDSAPQAYVACLASVIV